MDKITEFYQLWRNYSIKAGIAEQEGRKEDAETFISLSKRYKGKYEHGLKKTRGINEKIFEACKRHKPLSNGQNAEHRQSTF